MVLLQITINSYYIKKNHNYIDNYKFIMYINILMTLIVNYIIVYGLYYIYVCLHRVESDRIKLDYIGYPHIRVGSDTGFRSDTPKSISNPYLFKKIGFYPYPYPLSSQRIFLLFDRIGSDGKSTDRDTFAIYNHYI